MPPNKQKQTSSTKESYLSISGKDRESVFAKYDKTVDSFEMVQTKERSEKATALEVVKDTSVRPPFSRFDYEYFRPYETIPKIFPQLVRACRTAYQRIGLIRNAFDMMTDFAIEGMKIIHQDEDVETFYKIWARKVKLNDAVDEFVRHLLVDGNIVVKRVTGRLNKPTEEQWKEESKAEPDHSIKKALPVHEPREIPVRYIFLNVAALQFVGGDPARLAGERNLMFQLSNQVATMILQPNGLHEQAIVEKLPKDIREVVNRKSGNLIPLDMDKLFIAHHKKDCWDDWAPPFLGAVLTDIYFKDKMRLAETAALDGIINVIRLWKIGDHKEGILPSDAAVQKLVSILSNNTGGGAVDLVWDTMIEMQPYYPPVDKILGSEKYDKIDRDILIGIGLPEVLLGGKGGNFSNSFIQLKTLIEKLQYVRNKVNDWLAGEFEIVAKAMKFDTAARVRFNDLSLQDENAAKKLIISLWDRGIISTEAVLNTFGEDFEFEVGKIKSENEIFKKNKIEVHSPLNPPKNEGQSAPSGKKDDGTPGRPSNTNDTSKRDERTAKPKTKGAELVLYGLEVIESINANIIPNYMVEANIKASKKLTNEQEEEINNARIIALSCINSEDDISESSIKGLINEDRINFKVISSINSMVNEFINKNNRKPNSVESKLIYSLSWASELE